LYNKRVSLAYNKKSLGGAKVDKNRVNQLRKAVDSALNEVLEAKTEIDEAKEEWREIVSSHSVNKAEKIIAERNIFQRAKEARRRRDEAWKKYYNLSDELTRILRS
jgi:hypothetical protein